MWQQYAVGAVALASSFATGWQWFALVHKQRAPALGSAALALGATVLTQSWAAAAAAAACLLLGKRLRVAGLTGGIATGKSTVSALLKAKGAIIVDLDQLARVVVEPGSPVLRKLGARFGPAVVAPDTQRLDRAALRRIIATDPTARAYVNSLTHPAIARLMMQQIAWHRWLLGRTVVVDAPLLYESGGVFRVLCSPIVVVAADSDTQLQRLMARDSSNEADARAIMGAQMPVAAKAALADIVIDNGAGCNRESLAASVEGVWKRL